VLSTLHHIDAVKGGTFPCINPSTEEKICDVASATAEDIELAVQSCVQALEGPAWGYARYGCLALRFFVAKVLRVALVLRVL
jgi:acyl-CoA reductase-like NAD-dependent aldehyde dehydrogenase